MTIQYQGVWSLQSAAQLQSTQRWVTDPLFDYTTLLLQADDAANAAQNNTFLDSSSNNFTITRNGNTTQGSFTPFSQAPGYWGNYFDGTGDYITAAGANLALGTGNFTIEFWFYANAYSSAVDSAFMFDSRSGNNTSGFFIGPVFNNTQTLHVGQNTSPIITANTTYPLNTWVHCAVVRSSGTITLYQNGVNVGSVANTTNNTATTNYIGSGWWLPSGAGQMFNGYLSNLRISNTARYTANFNPAANVFVSDGNTVLLTCQSNRFVDGSSNGYTITVGGGTPSVQAFSPFAPQFQWTPSVIGGSGYFDYSGGSYLTITTAATNFYSALGDWTWEAWVYPLSFDGPQYSCGIMATSGDSVLIRATPNGTASSTNLNMYALNSAGAPILGNPGTSAGTIYLNTWSHVVFQRRSGQFDMFLNGVRIANNNTNTGVSLRTSDTAFLIGAGVAGTNPFWNGHISGVRVTNGTALYPNTTYTIPAAPPSPTGAAICVNMTNAGIYDGTMKNNLRTVGNAQVSTAVVKYGSGSMAFDGSGDYLSYTAGSPAFNLSAGDWTIEAWVYRNVSGVAHQIISLFNSAGSNSGLSIKINSSNLVQVDNGVTGTTAAGTVSANTWVHVAVVRSAGNIQIYVNGTAAGSAITQAPNTAQFFRIGITANDLDAFNGYIDDLRITRGIARYTANFIPPSVALPRQ